MIGKMTETMFDLWMSAGKLSGEIGPGEFEEERVSNKHKRLVYMDCLEKLDTCYLSVVVNEDVHGHIEHPGDKDGEGRIFCHLPAVRDAASDLVDRYCGEGKIIEMEAMKAFRGFVMWLEDEWCQLELENDFQTVATWLAQK